MTSHFSFGLAVQAVSVTRRDIDNGTSRSCTDCAIALALYRTLPLLGFHACYVRLMPYACFQEADGLEIGKNWNHRVFARMAVRDFPSGLVEWAMDFDEWADFNDDYGGSIRKPFRPDPVTFKFDWTKLQPV